MAEFISIAIYFLSVVFSVIILIIYLKRKTFFKKAILGGIAFFILFHLIYGIVRSVLTYNAWKVHPVYQYMTPSENPVYFYRFCFFHFFLSFFISLIGAIVLMAIFYILQRKGLVSFNETLLVFLSALIVGWPNLVFLFFLPFIIAIFLLIWQNYIKRDKIKKEVASAVPLIISLIIITAAGDFISHYLGFSVLKM